VWILGCCVAFGRQFLLLLPSLTITATTSMNYLKTISINSFLKKENRIVWTLRPHTANQHGQTDNYPFGSLSNQRRKQSIQYAITDGHEKLNYEGRNFDPNEETNSPVPS
jgi:hypothetical protein